MILPSKHLSLNESLLGVGADLLGRLDTPITVSQLWAVFQRDNATKAGQLPFDWFLLGLNFLYTISAVDIEAGKIVKRAQR